MTIPDWTSAWQATFDDLQRMRAAWPAHGWSWDARFSCCASSFAGDQETAARTAAALALPNEWTASTIGEAPRLLRDIAERTGGLRQGQLFLASSPLAGLTAYGLWWPWGGGKTVSLRVGLADVDPRREPFLRFRELFGVTL